MLSLALSRVRVTKSPSYLAGMDSDPEQSS